MRVVVSSARMFNLGSVKNLERTPGIFYNLLLKCYISIFICIALLKKSKQNTKEQFELIAKLRGRQFSHVYVSPLHFNTRPPCVWGGAVIAFYFSVLRRMS